MWNLFCFPTKKETIEAWAKMLEDFAKVSIIALPVVFFGKESLIFKAFGIGGLILIAYCSLIIAKYTREKMSELIIHFKVLINSYGITSFIRSVSQYVGTLTFPD